MSETKTGPCTAKASCAGMRMALDGNGERGIGFHWSLLLNFETGVTTSRLAYRFPKAPKGTAKVILVNRCPWCGEDVSGSPTPTATTEESAP
jgi:hypothetical protein